MVNTAKKLAQHAESSNARTVVVACKIEPGLRLQLQRPVARMEDGKGGPEPRTYNAFYGKAYWVNGPARPVGTLPKGFPAAPPIEGGYALTFGIPKDFWEQWLEQNKRAPYVEAPDGAEHGMIFAYDSMESTVDAAREQEKLLSGLQPMSTDEDAQGKLTDRRLPRPMSSMLSKVGTEPHPQG